ncbi:MAG TPA: outer membrane lipoprotein-sorting protein [Steroidobacteraceae bacterium]|nr:outer membrane lipoprotein-sorting protein [Steroidobacteraceae bacterium]
MSRAALRPRLLATLLAAGAALAPALPAPAADAPSAQAIIAATDRVRNPGEPFRSTVTLTEYVGGSERNHDALVVFSKEDRTTHQFRNLIEYVDPPRDAGKKVLLDGHSLWFFDPASNISIRISAQQRLIGQAAIGDVLTVNLAIDYTATLTGAETIKDAARADRSCWHLDLKAANDQAVYAHVEYWVEQGTNYPIKGKFYSDSGRLLKILYYRSFATALGAVRPTEAVIIDAVDTSLATTAAFADYRDAEIPDAWFQRDYLPRLQVK